MSSVVVVEKSKEQQQFQVLIEKLDMIVAKISEYPDDVPIPLELYELAQLFIHQIDQLTQKVKPLRWINPISK